MTTPSHHRYDTEAVARVVAQARTTQNFDELAVLTDRILRDSARSWSMASGQPFNEHHVEDLIQEAHIAVLAGLANLRDENAYIGWLKSVVERTAKTSVRSEVRRRAREERSVQADPFESSTTSHSSPAVLRVMWEQVLAPHSTSVKTTATAIGNDEALTNTQRSHKARLNKRVDGKMDIYKPPR